jgi:hypothetical protein
MDRRDDPEALRIREIFYHSAEVLLAIWYTYREHLFDYPISKLERVDGNLHVYRASHEPQQILHQYSYITSFSEALRSGRATPQEKKSVLCYRACADAVAWMQDLVKKLLLGD